MVNSATVDDLSIEACIYEFLCSLRTGEFLSCDTNMGCGMSVMLGNELTTLWEADGTIKKREERRRYKWASGWIGGARLRSTNVPRWDPKRPLGVT